MSTPETEVIQEPFSPIYDQFSYLIEFYNRHTIKPLQTTIDIIKVNLRVKPRSWSLEKIQADYELVLHTLAHKFKLTEKNLQTIAIDNLSRLDKLRQEATDEELKYYYSQLYEQYQSILKNLKADNSKELQAQINYLLHMDEDKIFEIIENHKGTDLYKRFQQGLQMQSQALRTMQQKHNENEPRSGAPLTSPRGKTLENLANFILFCSFATTIVFPLVLGPAWVLVFPTIIVGVIISACLLLVSQNLAQNGLKGTYAWRAWRQDFDTATSPIQDNISKLNASNEKEFLEEINALYIEESMQASEFDGLLEQELPDCKAVAASLEGKSNAVILYAKRNFAFFQQTHPDLGYSFEEVQRHISTKNVL